MDRETASDRRGKTADIDTQTNEDKHQEEQTQNDRNMSRRETDPERWRLGRETGKQRHSEPTKAEWEGGRQQALQIVLLEANLPVLREAAVTTELARRCFALKLKAGCQSIGSVWRFCRTGLLL